MISARLNLCPSSLHSFSVQENLVVLCRDFYAFISDCQFQFVSDFSFVTEKLFLLFFIIFENVALRCIVRISWNSSRRDAGHLMAATTCDRCAHHCLAHRRRFVGIFIACSLENATATEFQQFYTCSVGSMHTHLCFRLPLVDDTCLRHYG